MNPTQELWPTEHANSLIENLTEYLTTTFALSDTRASAALENFLQQPDRGMFRGPYVRLRLPFASDSSALDAEAKPTSLDFYPVDYAPYGHQLEAFNRLTTKSGHPGQFRRPAPTLVTTGTGSGKTEAFLFPILDHVLRAKREGITGIKALILYPMNALANDQASRLTDLLTTRPELSGITAGIYTGQQDTERSQVTAEGLINNRHFMQQSPPDILLTNYKMLDQLLLRAEDSRLWQASATSLQYLVLDEFHTYDGAQGTDVAMLLRRLGAALKSYWPADLSGVAHGPEESDRDKPLGCITPVATSATLGGGLTPGEESPMLAFAKTVFGIDFPHSAVVPESRLSINDWLARGANVYARPREDREIRPEITKANAAIRHSSDPQVLIAKVLNVLFEKAPAADSPADIQAALKAHPWTRKLLETATEAVALPDLADQLLVSGDGLGQKEVAEFLTHLLAVFSHVRKHLDRAAVTVETHLWVREVSRLDSFLDHTPAYRWADDGPVPEDAEGEGLTPLPAIFCRHCGARGWASMLTPDGHSVEMNGPKIREASVRRDPKIRALMDASKEIDALLERGRHPNVAEGLEIFHTRNRVFLKKETVFTETGNSVDFADDYKDEFDQQNLLAVRMHHGLTAEDLSYRQVCPVCDTPDAIRFVGSSIATLLTVAVSGLFGAEHLDTAEKKALVFTDSVQDAAHRAGFIQSRSHTFTLRTLLRQGMAELAANGQHAPSLADVVDTVMDLANNGEASDRFMVVPPELTEHHRFKPFWDPEATRSQRSKAKATVRRRLLFDAELEFGLQARFGRTLELTGAAVAETDVPSGVSLPDLAKAALARRGDQLELGLEDDSALAQWARGVLIRMRLQGGLAHPWLEKYLRHDGHRWHIWAGRRRSEGAPPFPTGRSTPAFPRVGGEKPKDSELDAVTAAEAWYSWWTRQALGAGREEAGHLAKALFAELAEAGVLETHTSEKTQAVIYALHPERIRLTLTRDEDLAGGKHSLACTACRAKTMGTQKVVEQMDGAPCLHLRCTGTLKPAKTLAENYYRQRLYGARRISRVIAREHTSLLHDSVRLEYEDQFRQSSQTPSAPNVLVATPTLEMGIDIGSLSTVMLSSMPTSVASYVQRVGRAGRLSGNSLALAFVQGRGKHLPRLHEPLSVINGDVRPPGTYLEADEILRRQFLAFCGDILARTEDAPRPNRLTDVLRSITEDQDNYLGRIISLLSIRGQETLDQFLSQFGDELPLSARERLQQWALGPQGQGETALISRLHQACHRYNADLLEQQERKKRITALMPTLREALATALRTSTAADSKDVADAKEALRGAESSLRQTGAVIDQLTTKQWWISGLERYGLFPNYTLIEDSVELEARISWLDESDGEWRAEVYPFQRGAEAALRELAPGSTFYAQGMQLEVDAVELGPESSHLKHWQVCPSCGWINTEVHSAGESGNGSLRWSNAVQACPRCEAAGVADTGQVLNVVVLEKVSAEMRRDEAAINDRRDDRARSSYEILAAADIDPDAVREPWYVKDFAFGAEFLESVTLRWLNLGPRGHHARARTLVGQEVQAPMFRVCAQCGTRDRHIQSNHAKDHRFWCSYRNDVEEQSLEIALARELTTQAVLLHLPVELIEDTYTIPTLKAALLLGMQEAFRGTPAHLHVMEVPEQESMSSGGYSGQTLLLHDNIPGGTGYLAEFTQPEKVHAMLHAAWKVVSQCLCDSGGAQERQLACHRCLLPHADHHAMDLVSRSSAERILSTLLAATSDNTGPFAPWQTTQERSVVEGSGESPLEIQFREVLRQRVEAEGGVVTQDVQKGRTRLSFTLPGHRRQWLLEPQVDLAGTRPDFLLRSPGVPHIAIYTDGRQYHASQKHNRLGDDAQKRHSLRVSGEAIPWALTDQDIRAFRADSAPAVTPVSWINSRYLEMLGAETKLVSAMQRSAMHLLWEWLHQPDREVFAEFAHRVALASMPQGKPPRLAELDPTALEPAPQVEPGVISERLSLGAGPQDRWWRRHLGAADLFVAVGRPGPNGLPTSPRVVYSLEDTPEALAAPDFAHHWRDWLLVSTVLSFRPTMETALLTRRSAESILAADYAAVSVPVTYPAPRTPTETPVPDQVPQTTAEAEITPEWRDAIEKGISAVERALLRELAALELPIPEVGEEQVDGIPVDIAYPSAQIAVFAVDGQGVEEELAKEGWTVLVAPSAAEIADMVRSN
ncbi:DEAD/DEAH box helicase [Nesterenkonia sphaerica]|uniref:DEAD/DEAH box helicase n=1 Tax=Nesterenkonia sphaerica TaxID=1804988 RepID=A0A5R9A2H0_9MICC|nr:DEAD/DEAH box helicase [Nesterenkonia sphaerica]TLP72889.1 DEAD/DEAH box helicase [Nesterenkonia sphaerica]